MKHVRGPAVLAVSLSLTYSGCSLMNLDDLNTSPCKSDLDCAAAQARAGLDATLCGHCLGGLCDFQHRTETCNGKDDDCDGLIDEDVTVIPRRLTGMRAPLGSVAIATSPAAPLTTYVASAGGGAPRGFAIDEDGTVTPDALVYDAAGADPGYPCRYPGGEDRIGEQVCKFTELAIAVDSRHVLYAAINQSGCDEGQLRVGLAERRNEPFKLQLGDPSIVGSSEVGNLALGVDSLERCSVKSIPPGAVVGVKEGARSPAIASIDTAPGAAGALVAWVGASAGATVTCGNAVSAPVRALGLSVHEDAESSLFGTNNGVPATLGASPSLAPPAIVPLELPGDDPSFLVGFVGEHGRRRGIRLSRVTSKKYELGVESIAFIPDAFAERVTLALGENEAGEPRLGVLWTAPCAAAPALHFATVSLPSGEVTGSVDFQTSRLLRAPQLLFRAEGFSSVPPRGGWFVLWAQQTLALQEEAKLARLVDGAGEPLNVVTLSAGTIGLPFLLPSGATSVREMLLQDSIDDREAVGAIVGWCGVRG